MPTRRQPPNPALARVVDGSYLLDTPCCATQVTLVGAADRTHPREVTCGLCPQRWTVTITRDPVDGLVVSWRPA